MIHALLFQWSSSTLATDSSSDCKLDYTLMWKSWAIIPPSAPLNVANVCPFFWGGVELSIEYRPLHYRSAQIGQFTGSGRCRWDGRAALRFGAKGRHLWKYGSSPSPTYYSSLRPKVATLSSLPSGSRLNHYMEVYDGWYSIRGLW